MTQLIERLRGVLEQNSLLTSEEDCRQFGMDWTKIPGSLQCVVLPRTVEQVSKILKLCGEFRTPVIASGGRTGLAGGVVGKGKEVGLSLLKMNRIDAVDQLGFTVRVQAGATTQAVHEHCEKVGLTWPIDLAAKGTSTIGGNLSTNAGGLRVIRYGMARKWVSALQAVTMSGEVLELNRGLEKNNTGYDLVQLLIGSEGTLAVITEATLKLVTVPKNTMVLFFGLADIKNLSRLFLKVRGGPFTVLACEFFSELCLNAVEKCLNRKSRLKDPGSFYLIVEIEVPEAPVAASEVDRWLESVLEAGMVTDGLLAQSSRDQDQVWGLREGITESLQQLSQVKKYDVAVPVADVACFLDQVLVMFHSNGYEMDLYLFGHYGDGSPHLNLLKRAGSSDVKFVEECKRFNEDLYPLVLKHSGSISAEHGIGILKKDWIPLSRSAEELRLFKQIKRAFDPNGLLNPGKVIDL